MEFNKVEIDGDLDDMEAGELRELVRQFSDAQAANEDTFEEVADTVSEFSDVDDELTERVTEEADLPEEEAAKLSFSAKRDLLSGLDATESGDTGDGGDGGGDGEFNDTGTRGPTHGENGVPEFVEEAFEDMGGVVLNS